MSFIESVTNDELLNCIKILQNEDPAANIARVFDLLKKARLLVPVTVAIPEKPESNSKPHTLSQSPHQSVFSPQDVVFLSIQDSGGNRFLPVFTDSQELKRWSASCPRRPDTMVLSFSNCQTLVLDGNHYAGLVLNPSGVNLIFNRLTLQSMVLKSPSAENETTRLPEGSSFLSSSDSLQNDNVAIKLGRPKRYPKKLVKALSKYFKTQKSIKAAYLQLKKKGTERTYLIVIESKKNLGEFIPQITEIGISCSSEFPLEIIDVKSDLGQNAIRNIHPFYKRKILGFF